MQDGWVKIFQQAQEADIKCISSFSTGGSISEHLRSSLI